MMAGIEPQRVVLPSLIVRYRCHQLPLLMPKQDAMNTNLQTWFSLSLSLSLRFDGHFPRVPGLAGTRMFPFWILFELRVMEVVVTTAGIRRAKLQSNTTNKPTPSCFTGRMPFLSPNRQCQSTEGKNMIHTIYKKLHTVRQDVPRRSLDSGKTPWAADFVHADQTLPTCQTVGRRQTAAAADQWLCRARHCRPTDEFHPATGTVAETSTAVSRRLHHQHSRSNSVISYH